MPATGHLWYAAASRGPCSYTTFYARRGVLAAKRDELRRLVRGLYRTQKWLHAQPARGAGRYRPILFPERAAARHARGVARYRAARHLGPKPDPAADGYERLRMGLVSGGFVKQGASFDERGRQQPRRGRSPRGIDRLCPRLEPVSERFSAAPHLKMRTLGHASLAVHRDGERPLLLTDPWLVGSVYWRSWWLQHYPSGDELDWLSTTAHVYVTHEHPDHFHMPSIRRLGAGPLYLLPDLAEQGWRRYLSARGYRAKAAPATRWLALGEGVSMLSIPVWNDDSLLLIDTPNALILNLNDAKPLPPILRAIRRVADRIAKPRILVCSYSPASVVNSFVDDNGIVSLKSSRHYVDYVCRLCDRLGADHYLPFASQAVFCRPDSIWANDYRTTYEHLRQYWHSRARLLPPYTTLDLADFSYTAFPTDEYRPMDASILARCTGERTAAEETAQISDEEVKLLERKLNAFRWLYWMLFPRGFAFRLGECCLSYDPRHGRLCHATGELRGDFVVDVPKATMKEALQNNHLTDLGITMFVRIRLLRPIDPRKAYGLFVLFQFDDYGHLAGAAAFCRWFGRGLRYTLVPRLPLPARPR